MPEPVESESPDFEDLHPSAEDLLEDSERPLFLAKADQLVVAFDLPPDSRPLVEDGLVQALYAIACNERRANAASEALTTGDAETLGREWARGYRRRMHTVWTKLREAMDALEAPDGDVPSYIHHLLLSSELGGEGSLTRDLLSIRRVISAAEVASRGPRGRPRERRDGWPDAIAVLRSTWKDARPGRQRENYRDRRLDFVTDALRWLVRDVLKDTDEFVTAAFIDDVLHKRRRALR